MGFFRKLIPSTPRSFSQTGNSRNRAALRGLRELGYEMPSIRLALLKLNGLKIKAMANGISFSTLHYTLTGKRQNPAAQKILAEKIGIPRDELFPEEEAPAR